MRKKKVLSDEEKKKLSEADRRYREANYEKINMRRAKYREENREKIREKAKQHYKEKPEVHVLHNIKARAKRQGVPFDLTPEDLVAPEFCPVLGIKLERSLNPKGGVTDYAPTVDRLVPRLGYVKGNIIIVSHKANRIKNNATVDELEAVAAFYRALFDGIEEYENGCD